MVVKPALWGLEDEARQVESCFNWSSEGMQKMWTPEVRRGTKFQKGNEDTVGVHKGMNSEE